MKKETKDEKKALATSLRNLVYSTVSVNWRQSGVGRHDYKLSQETDTMLDIINDIPRRHQKQLLVGYGELLQSVIDSVDHKLNTL